MSLFQMFDRVLRTPLYYRVVIGPGQISIVKLSMQKEYLAGSWISFGMIKLFQPIKCRCCPHTETSQLICCANQLTDFYMKATLTLNGLMSCLSSSRQFKVLQLSHSVNKQHKQIIFIRYMLLNKTFCVHYIITSCEATMAVMFWASKKIFLVFPWSF